jgi:hypothetical protein
MSMRNSVLATLAALVAFGVYLRTLAPGLVAVIDTPAFQFVGRVLGVVHHPGYPLYTLLTHVFSYLPVGTLAYRINLFSALWGAVTVGLVVLILRRLGTHAMIAVATALSLAFGGIFWSQAVIAEVYTLNAALVAGMVLALLRWEETRCPRAFFLAVGLLALGLGHHTTIVLFVPGAMVFVLLVAPGFVRRRRTLAIVAGLLALGLLQYTFILIRSRQPGVYLESSAPDLQSLVALMTGRQFGDGLFAFDARQVVVERVPWILGQFIAAELTVPVLLLAVAGAALLARHQPRRAVLLLGGAAGILAFAINYDAIDVEVFTIPALMILWICAGRAADVAARRFPRSVAPVVLIAALLFPAWQLARNYGQADMSSDTEAAWQMRYLFESLPRRAVLVREDFLIDRMVMYMLLGEGAAAGREILVQSPDPDLLRKLQADGFDVFAFGTSAARLRYEGLDFSFASVPILAGPLSDWLMSVPDGSPLALAVPASDGARFAAADGTSLQAIGARGVGGRDQSSLAVLGAAGARQPAREVVLSSGPARIELPEGDTIPGTRTPARTAIQVHAAAERAAIAVGPRDIVSTTDGAVAARWSGEGALLAAFVLEADAGFRVPLLAGPLSLFPLRGEWPSQALSAGWEPISSRTGSLMLRLPPGSSAVLYMGHDLPFNPSILDHSAGPLQVQIDALDAWSPEDLKRRRTTDRAPARAATESAYLYRIEASVSDAADWPVSVIVALGGRPADMIGRSLAPDRAARPLVYEVNTRDLLRVAGDPGEILLMGRTAQRQLLGHGWSPVDGDVAGPFRWTTAAEAHLLLPLQSADPARIAMQVLGAPGPDRPRTVSLRLNGTDLPVKAVQPGWHWYEWDVPAGTLVAGTNEAAVVVDRAPSAQPPGIQPGGIAVARIVVGR